MDIPDEHVAVAVARCESLEESKMTHEKNKTKKIKEKEKDKMKKRIVRKIFLLLKWKRELGNHDEREAFVRKEREKRNLGRHRAPVHGKTLRAVIEGEEVRSILGRLALQPNPTGSQ
jgi:hypothetical protein